MKRITILICLFISALALDVMAAYSPPSSDQFKETPGDSSSNNLQKQIDDDDISANQAKKDIENGDFDAEDGGLYCPDKNCGSDPEDVANGF